MFSEDPKSSVMPLAAQPSASTRAIITTKADDLKRTASNENTGCITNICPVYICISFSGKKTI